MKKGTESDNTMLQERNQIVERLGNTIDTAQIARYADIVILVVLVKAPIHEATFVTRQV